MLTLKRRVWRRAFCVVSAGFALSGTSLSGFALPHAFQHASQPGAQAAAKVEDAWGSMYLGEKKVGFTHAHKHPTRYQNKPAIETTSQSSIKMTVLGASVEQNIEADVITDTQDRPLQQTLHVSSNGQATDVLATYDYAHHQIICKIGTGSNAATKIVAIPPGVNLAGDTDTLLAGKKLAVGQKFIAYALEPLTVELQKAEMEVTGRDTIKNYLTGKTVSAFIIKSSTPQGQSQSWATPDGESLQNVMSIGPLTLTTRQEPKQMAMGTANLKPSGGGKTYTPPGDLAVATAITVDKPIEKERSVRDLRATISGIPGKRYLLSDARQNEERVENASSDSETVKIEVKAGLFDANQSASLPISGDNLKTYLASAPYLNTADANIQKTALQVRGDETNAYKVACLLRDWVHKKMTPDASIGVPRSASDIFQKPRGVCRDYSTLYTALARAAGIPTRVCSGIVYAEGKFFYHAWAECYVGQWVAFDPTLYDPAHPVDFVDATHIKFAQGDPTDMFSAAALIGKLHITIQDTAL